MTNFPYEPKFYFKHSKFTYKDKSLFIQEMYIKTYQIYLVYMYIHSKKNQI